jgi:sec-independent protein translocase protein TatB
MFDLDASKMIVFGIVALAVIPAKDLPRVLRTVGQYVGKMRRMASDFQGQFMDAMREADIESVKKEIRAMEESTKIDTSFDPTTVMRSEMTRAVDAPKDVGSASIALAPPSETREVVGEPRVAESHLEKVEPAAPSHSA